MSRVAPSMTVTTLPEKFSDARADVATSTEKKMEKRRIFKGHSTAKF